MAENDIYDSEGKYTKFKSNLSQMATDPATRGSRAKYWCKCADNLKYFEKLFIRFDSKDLSFVRRMRLCKSFMIVLHHTDKKLAVLDREDIDKVLAGMHQVYKSPKSKSDFIKDIRYMWKIILPEKDVKGRPDEMLVPYVVRHLSPKVDKSKQKTRNDKLDLEEFHKILDFFSSDLRMQAYLMLALESIARPQELLYRKIRDIEHKKPNYAIITLSDHGKEGTGILQCIDAYPFLMRWLEVHPFKNDLNAYIFVNTGNKKMGAQMTPVNINKRLEVACKILKIPKHITCYSLKRNGVTFRRLRGDTDMEIQHAARWTSAKQLKTYDMSTQNDALQLQLIKKGLIPPDKIKAQHKHAMPRNIDCPSCGKVNPFNALKCNNCECVLHNRDIMKAEKAQKKKFNDMQEQIANMKEQLEVRKPYEAMMEKLLQNEQVQEIVKQELS